MVTSVPRSLIIEANSQPIAPPPITMADAGSSGIESNSSEVTIRRSSIGKPLIVRGTDPAASTTRSAEISTSPEAPPLMATVR